MLALLLLWGVHQFRALVLHLILLIIVLQVKRLGQVLVGVWVRVCVLVDVGVRSSTVILLRHLSKVLAIHLVALSLNVVEEVFRGGLVLV